MAEENTPQTTLRDTINNAFDEVQKQEVVEQPKVETQESDKARDDKGRFSKSSAPPETAGKSAAASSSAPVDMPQAVAEPKRLQRPSSWKKDYWDHWDKLDPKVAEYILQREQEAARGISTYKKEWDNAKPLLDAVAPLVPTLQQWGMTPQSWISEVGRINQTLTSGTPEQKLAILYKMAQDYQVPIHNLFVRGQDGNIYRNPNIQIHQAQQAQPDVRQVVKQLLQEEAANREVQQLASEAEKYPNFEQVREAMAGLLQAGLADDLKSAYDKAIRLHPDLHDSILAQQREQEEAKKREETARVASSARAKAVSPKSSTPAGVARASGGKGIRESIESAFDEKISGRF